MDAPIGGKSKRQEQQAQTKTNAESKKKLEAQSSSQSTKKMSFQEVLDLRENLIQDWSRNGEKIIGHVIDQKEKDICWAICFTGLVQASHNIGLSPDQQLDFSYEELIDHIVSKDKKNFALSNMKKVFKHIGKNGIMKVPINKQAKAGALGKRITENLDFFPDVDASFIQQKLDTSPVALVLEINDLFSNLQQEIYYLPKKKITTKETRLHIMLLFGYGRTKKGELYFIAQNSYGETWGCNGCAPIIIRENCDIVCVI